MSLLPEWFNALATTPDGLPGLKAAGYLWLFQMIQEENEGWIQV
jgi:hypothetical protein